MTPIALCHGITLTRYKERNMKIESAYSWKTIKLTYWHKYDITGDKSSHIFTYLRIHQEILGIFWMKYGVFCSYVVCGPNASGTSIYLYSGLLTKQFDIFYIFPLSVICYHFHINLSFGLPKYHAFSNPLRLGDAYMLTNRATIVWENGLSLVWCQSIISASADLL